MIYGSGCMKLPPLTPAQQRLLDAVIHHLETLNVTERLHKLSTMLGREVNVLEVGAEIQSQSAPREY